MVIHMISRAVHGSQLLIASQMRRTSSTSSPGTSSRTLQDWVVAPFFCEEKGTIYQEEREVNQENMRNYVCNWCDLSSLSWVSFHRTILTEVYFSGYVMMFLSLGEPIHQFTNSWPSHVTWAASISPPAVLTEIYPLFWPLLLYIHDQNFFKCHKHPHVTVITALH